MAFCKKTSHNFVTSLKKELSYIEAMILEPVEVRCKDKNFSLVPVSNFKISPLLFERYYSCLEHLGCSCCSGFWNFTQKELACPEMTGESLDLIFNGNSISYFVNAFEGKPCPFSIKGCKIHRNNPITCMFPLIQFRRDKRTDTVLLTKTHFGRNWLLGCPVVFRPYQDIEHFMDDVMWKFEYLNRYMDNTGVKHRASYVKSQVKDGARDYFRRRDVPRLIL